MCNAVHSIIEALENYLKGGNAGKKTAEQIEPQAVGVL